MFKSEKREGDAMSDMGRPEVNPARDPLEGLPSMSAIAALDLTAVVRWRLWTRTPMQDPYATLRGLRTMNQLREAAGLPAIPLAAGRPAVPATEETT